MITTAVILRVVGFFVVVALVVTGVVTLAKSVGPRKQQSGALLESPRKADHLEFEDIKERENAE